MTTKNRVRAQACNQSSFSPVQAARATCLPDVQFHRGSGAVLCGKGQRESPEVWENVSVLVGCLRLGVSADRPAAPCSSFVGTMSKSLSASFVVMGQMLPASAPWLTLPTETRDRQSADRTRMWHVSAKGGLAHIESGQLFHCCSPLGLRSDPSPNQASRSDRLAAI